MNATDLLAIKDVILSDTVTSILFEAIQDESTFVQAELMYRSLQRSEPIWLSSLPLEERYEIVSDVKLSMVNAEMEARGITKPDPRYEENEQDLDDYYDVCESIFENIQLQEDFAFVYLCNYKGEGEGCALFSLAEHLPVYIDKQHSFELFRF